MHKCMNVCVIQSPVKGLINNLLFIQAFQSVLVMAENRTTYPEFCIPMTVIPATISNNVPGTDFSLGADTAVNEITDVNLYIVKLKYFHYYLSSTRLLFNG